MLRYGFDLDKLDCPNGMISIEDGGNGKFMAVTIPSEGGHKKMVAYGLYGSDGLSWIHKDFRE